MNIRLKIAQVCFWLSSLFKAAGIRVRSKEKTIVAEMLSLPGWFIIDEQMIHQMPYDRPGLKNGFEWHCYPMPWEWCQQMRNLKN